MATKKAGTDQKTMTLIAEVKRRKEEIARSEKPNWKTNCSFSFQEGKMGEAINLHVEANLRTLIGIASFLRERESRYAATAAELGVESVPAFTWQGYAVGDWIDDVKARIGKVQIAEKRKKLEALETRLNAVVSPELRAQLELDAIAGELGS